MSVKKAFFAFLSVIALIGVGKFFTFSTKEELSEDIHKNINKEVLYRIRAFEYGHDINFCGERAPLHAQDIYESFDREVLKNAYWHSEMLLYFKRTGKYFPIMEPILKQHGIPKDFLYLAIIESGLDNVVSPAGAAGFWQFMEKTAIEYGLEVNAEIDERYDLEKATHAACKYLNDAYKRFNSWTLVAASYNMGMSGLERKMKIQQTENYYDLLLNTETSRYVLRVLAVKDIFESPEKYGFNIDKKYKYAQLKYKKITVKESINDLADFGIKQGYNYKIIKLLNPWIRKDRLIVLPGKSYQIALPTENFYVFSQKHFIEVDSLSAQTDSIVGK